MSKKVTKSTKESEGNEMSNACCESFDDMKLNTELLKGIYQYGFEKPSSIQQLAIVPFYKGADLIAQSQSGTGKTGAFCIGMLQRINDKVSGIQGLIMAPTRELANQIHKVITALSTEMGYNIGLYIGGMNKGNFSSFRRFKSEKTKEQQKEEAVAKAGGEQIIIGTPGRILDMLKRKKIDLTNLKTTVLDEADEMLSRGFLQQIYEIFQYFNESVQIALFSATMPEEMFELTEKFMNNPKKILVKKEEVTLEGIKQFYVELEKDAYKYDVLCDLYETINITQSIIYCNTKKKVEQLTETMLKNDFTVSALTGNMEQAERNKLMEEFRGGKARVLITTDILARGIDVQQVSLVINYDLPFEKETYIHRIGRSGRFGRKGVAINFVTPRDFNKLKELEEFYKTHVEEMPMNVADLL